MNKLKTFPSMVLAVALTSLLPGCVERFGNGVPFPPPFDAGVPPLTSAIFCDIEATRRCATNYEIIEGIDVTQPFEAGFYVNKSSRIGLDYRPAALAACAGGPQAVFYQDAFPNGTPVCLSPTAILGQYVSVNAACQYFCYSLGLIDGDGHQYSCKDIAWQSNGSERAAPNAAFANACMEGGTLRADFIDPRKIRPTTPIEWTALVGVQRIGSDLNDLQKTNPTGWGSQDPALGAGAISVQQLTAGDGFVQITASASTTNNLRIFGLGNGTSSTTFEDVEHGLLLTEGGSLVVHEKGQFTAVGSYQPGDTLSVGVEKGVIVYKQRTVGSDTFSSLPALATAPVYPLVVKTAFHFMGTSTINGARIAF